MSRRVRTWLWLSLLVVIVAACREYMPSNRYLHPRQPPSSTSSADARHKFDHAAHGRIFTELGTTCEDCHRFDAQIDTGAAPLANDASTAALYPPGSSACHHCHGPSETRIPQAPSACTTCHSNMAPLLPENHQVAWLRVHASVASADPVACQNCHRDAFCINCHQNRDQILTFVHDRNYLSFHSVDARANPIQCGNCHREDFCLNCHANSVK